MQVLGDRKGNVVHLHERDCSVQRRYQKVVEVAPSIGLPDEVVNSLCGAGVELANKIGYDNAGTVEFLLDQDTNEWFFIEMNPRIQVEHTVTEQITGIDIVRSQILVAMNHGLHDNKIGIPQQNEIPRNGCADPVQGHHGGSGKGVYAGLRKDSQLSFRCRFRSKVGWCDGRHGVDHNSLL